MFAAASHARKIMVDQVRSTMAGLPSDFVPTASLVDIWKAWRRVQVRQLFRLSLEALFYWTIVNLEGKPKRTDALVDAFLSQAPHLPKRGNAREWLRAALRSATGPTELMGGIKEALNVPGFANLAPRMVAGFALCLAEPPHEDDHFERPDRLPFVRRGERGREKGSDRGFFSFCFLILGPSPSMSIGPLAGAPPAPPPGKNLLRLRVMLDRRREVGPKGATGVFTPLATPGGCRRC